MRPDLQKTGENREAESQQEPLQCGPERGLLSPKLLVSFWAAIMIDCFFFLCFPTWSKDEK